MDLNLSTPFKFLDYHCQLTWNISGNIEKRRILKQTNVWFNIALLNAFVSTHLHTQTSIVHFFARRDSLVIYFNM